MKITGEMNNWQFKDFQYQTIIGSPMVEASMPRAGLIKLQCGTCEVTVSKRELQAILNALDEQEQLL